MTNEKIFFPTMLSVMLVMLAVPASYCEPGLTDAYLEPHINQRLNVICIDMHVVVCRQPIFLFKECFLLSDSVVTVGSGPLNKCAPLKQTTANTQTSYLLVSLFSSSSKCIILMIELAIHAEMGFTN